MVPEHNVTACCGPDNVTSTPKTISCPRCGFTLRPKSPKPPCKPITLQLSRRAKIRRKLARLIEDSELPNDEFAQYVLGLDDMTVHRYLKGHTLPQSRMVQLDNIEHISRSGNMIHLTIRTCAPRPRWEWMLKERNKKRGRKHTQTADLSTAL